MADGPNLDKIAAGLAGTPYVAPPPEYSPPTECEDCGEMIYFGSVTGGHKWLHLTGPGGHDVVMRAEGYFETTTGETIFGNPITKGSTPR